MLNAFKSVFSTKMSYPNIRIIQLVTFLKSSFVHIIRVLPQTATPILKRVRALFNKLTRALEITRE